MTHPGRLSKVETQTAVNAAMVVLGRYHGNPIPDTKAKVLAALQLAVPTHPCWMTWDDRTWPYVTDSAYKPSSGSQATTFWQYVKYRYPDFFPDHMLTYDRTAGSGSWQGVDSRAATMDELSLVIDQIVLPTVYNLYDRSEALALNLPQDGMAYVPIQSMLAAFGRWANIISVWLRLRDQLAQPVPVLRKLFNWRSAVGPYQAMERGCHTLNITVSTKDVAAAVEDLLAVYQDRIKNPTAHVPPAPPALMSLMTSLATMSGTVTDS